ncbi:MAG TPA: hypothetical protein VGK19_13430 [Capsulimonadaceae bacterium]|jgi:hypothetical protein
MRQLHSRRLQSLAVCATVLAAIQSVPASALADPAQTQTSSLCQNPGFEQVDNKNSALAANWHGMGTRAAGKARTGSYALKFDGAGISTGRALSEESFIAPETVKAGQTLRVSGWAMAEAALPPGSIGLIQLDVSDSSWQHITTAKAVVLTSVAAPGKWITSAGTLKVPVEFDRTWHAKVTFSVWSPKNDSAPAVAYFDDISVEPVP